MKLRFTEDSIIVVDDLNNSMVIDKETIKRVFGLQEIGTVTPVTLPSSQEKIIKIIKENQINNPAKEQEEQDFEEVTVPESVARRYEPVQKESDQDKEKRLVKTVNKLNTTIFSRVFRGKIKVIPFQELPLGLQQRYLSSIKKYSLYDNFKKNIGRTIGSVRLSKQWQTFQKELLSKYHEERQKETKETSHA